MTKLWEWHANDLDIYLSIHTLDLCISFITFMWCFRSQWPKIESTTWGPSQYPKRRLSVRSRKVSKPRDLYLELSDLSEIWQALRQQCCRCACQISKRYDNLKYQSRGFETSRDLTKRRLFGYWDGALDLGSPSFGPGFILCMHPANERRRYIVTSALTGRAHMKNNPVPYIGHRLALPADVMWP